MSVMAIFHQPLRVGPRFGASGDQDPWPGRVCVAGLWVHNEHLVAGQCAIRRSDRDRPGGGRIRDSGTDVVG